MAKILDRATADRVFLIYGNLSDMFIAEDLIPCRFEYYLMKYLKSLGFKNVVFFSPNDKGRYTIDDESAAFTERKKLMSNQRGGGLPQQRGSGHKLTMGKKGRRSFGDNEKNGHRGDEPKTEGDLKEKEQAAKQELKYKFPNINLADFVEMAQSYLTGKDGRTAVIFTNIQTFLTSQPPQKYHAMLSGEWINYTGNPDAGICIFLAPNGCVSGIHTMLTSSGMSEISNYFFEESDRIRYDRTIHVGNPERDEIRNLLEYMRIIGYQYKRRSFRLFFERNDMEKIVDCIYRCSRNRDLQPRERDLTQLSGIFQYLSDYIYQKCRMNPRAAGVRLSLALARKLFLNSGEDSQISALERLHVSGWEPVYERLEEIVDTAKKDKKKREEAQETETDVIVETEKEESDAISEEEAPICVSCRLDLDFGKKEVEDNTYTGPVPSFILKGHPGVGKTEIAEIIASVLYEAGILRTDRCLKRNRQELMSDVVGGVDVIMRNLLMDAEEGVLFIDEAYQLYEEKTSNDFGKRVLDALLAATDPKNPSHRICVILAGYPEEMDRMMHGSNAGLLSRFGEENNILIPDATPELMLEKFLEFIEDEGYHIPLDQDGKLVLPMETFFKNMYRRRNRRTFGNFRTITKLAQSVCGNASLRLNPEMEIRKEDFRDDGKYFESTGPATKEAALQQIDEFVGMDAVKKKILDIQAQEEKRQDHKKRGIPVAGKPKHYIFKGNPGVGKTSIGHIMGSVFYLSGILGAEETRVIDASELLVGTADDPTEKVRRIVQEAIDNNQFLFIDEAYQIIDNVHGKEIVNAMLNPLSEKGREFRIGISLYPNRVDEFLELNPGLDRRFEIIEFRDYKPEELMEIFERNRQKLQLEITEETQERVKLIFKHKYNTRTETFGNAAIAVQLIEEMDSNHYRRMKQQTEESEDIYTLTLEDIPEKELKEIESVVHPKTAEEIEEEVNSMIGMGGLRTIMENIATEVQYAQKEGENAIYGLEPGHYFFIGRPGTGKTTSAEMFADYLYSLGVIKTKKIQKYSTKDLVSGYLGQSDKQAAKMLERGRNGVIFIDEAHHLAVSYGGGQSSYEQQVLGQLIQYMEDEEFRKTTCIILAGYEGEMEKLFNRNYGGDPGLRDRGRVVEFPDYNGEECWQIFEKFCEKNGISVTEGVQPIYTMLFGRLSGYEEFANGRTVRKVFRETCVRMKKRVIEGETLEFINVITTDDLLEQEEAIEMLGYQTLRKGGDS